MLFRSRFGKTNLVKKFHIGTPQTYSKARFRAAIAQAVELRAESLAQYEFAATKAKRKEASAMKKALSAAGRSGA